MRSTLDVKITTGNISNLTCPDPKCDHELQYHVIRFIVKPEIFSKYEKFMLQEHLQSQTDCMWDQISSF